MATQPQTWTEDVAMDFSLSTGGDGFFSGGNKYAIKMLENYRRYHCSSHNRFVCQFLISQLG